MALERAVTCGEWIEGGERRETGQRECRERERRRIPKGTTIVMRIEDREHALLELRRPRHGQRRECRLRRRLSTTQTAHHLQEIGRVR